MGADTGIGVDALHLFYDRSSRPLEVIGRHRGGPTPAERGAQGPEFGIEALHRPGQHHEAGDGRAGGREERETHTAKLPSSRGTFGDDPGGCRGRGP